MWETRDGRRKGTRGPYSPRPQSQTPSSSVTDAFKDLENMFEEQNRSLDVIMSFAGSSEVLAQIEQGAPANVFASADGGKIIPPFSRASSWSQRSSRETDLW